jgi:hypothetical protein
MTISKPTPIISGSTFLILKGRITFIQLKVGNQYVTDPELTADAFANHFKSTFNTNYQYITPSDQIAADFLPTALNSAAEVGSAIKRLRQITDPIGAISKGHTTESSGVKLL